MRTHRAVPRPVYRGGQQTVIKEDTEGVQLNDDHPEDIANSYHLEQPVSSLAFRQNYLIKKLREQQ